jgi:NAD(P)-dependent dehydrogenase (short-subunit alcohol dehydrogenase family)
MDTGLAGRSAIVTGGARGIGLACAAALSAEGAKLVLADVDGPAAEASAGALPGDAFGVAVDVTDPDGVNGMVEAAVSRHGGLDVLVTSAGIFHATPFDEITVEEWDRIQAVNLKGTFLCAQAALKVMVPQGRGRIVTIASLAAQTGGLAAGASYAASKGGVVSLTKSIARYAGPHGITANSINPGVIDSAMIASWPPGRQEATTAATPLQRIGTPDEVAASVVWLASDAAGFVHGTHLDVNGGLLMD